MDAESIVISGISGRFPGCDNTEELQKALIDGTDLVSDNHGRWAKDFYGLSNRGGIMKDIEKFDNGFFGIPPRQGDGLDPRTRILMETTFEAIVDAGVHPMDIRGSKTGVFIGMTTSRGNDSVFENKINYTRLGRSLAMTSGLIAFIFDLRGPSYALDTACSSSLYAFCQAFHAIRSGECEAAIVCGASIILDPYDSLEYKTMNILSPTGKCKFLDEERDGFVKSESVVVTYLQKSQDAKRIYATVKGCGTNTDGFKVEGVTKPSAEMQTKLMEDIYKEFNINPLDVTYMEAHGTGTIIGDVEETTAIANFLCKDRKEPLLIGSVKTNIGHTEMSSGLTSIIKVILSMEHGVIPPILHLNKLGEDITTVHEGKLKPVTELTPWNSGLIGVNSFGVGGTNAHVVLEPNLKKLLTNINPSIRLVHLAGRTEKGLSNFIDLVKNNPDNHELISLLDNIFYRSIRNYNHRAYVMLNEGEVTEETEKLDKEGRQVWFVYSGIGSQWAHMGRDLMKMDYFRQCMEECSKTLHPYNIDLIELITNGDAEVFKNVTNCFISIVAISICLTDVLRLLEIEPDGIIGHSVGEVCCAYVDGLISKNEAMLIAHARGVALQTTHSINGILAVVGITEEEANLYLPEDISIACYNCIDNLTISGPKNSVIDYVKKLKSEEKFAEIIQGANMAFHSKYITKAGDCLLELLKPIIRESKPCSKKWISSSVKFIKTEENNTENDKVDEEIGVSNEGVLHCPEYHRNNLINSVFFQSAMEQVPKDAIVVEISPKGLLQTVIRRNLGPDAKIIALSSELATNNFQYLLSAIGKLYLSGGNPNLKNLYNNNSTYPVSNGTPSLAPLIEWDRTMNCNVSYYSPEKSFGECIAVDLMDPTMKYLEGHMVEGKIIYPVMGYAYLAWEIFARLNKKPVSEVPVIIENLKIRRMTLLPKDNGVIFNINLLNSNGDFEISEGGAIVCLGTVKGITDTEKAFSLLPNGELGDLSHEYPPMNQDDVYYKLRRYGFNYQNHFQGIIESRGPNGTLKWCDYWIPFLDAAIHYTAATSTDKTIYLPESIGRLIIDPQAHLKLATELDNKMPLKYDTDTNIIQCGRVEVRDLQLIELAKRKSFVKPKLEKYQYIPYYFSPVTTLYNFLYLSLQVVLENMNEYSIIKILELHDPVNIEENGDESNSHKGTKLSQVLKDVISEEIVIQTIHDKLEVMNDATKLNSYDVIIIDKDIVNGILAEPRKSFIIIRESNTYDEDKLKKLNYTLISKFFTEDGIFLLIRQRKSLSKKIKVIPVTTKTFEWVNELKEVMVNPTEKFDRIYLLSENEYNCGIMGLFNCLRYEDGGTSIRMFFLNDVTEKFSIESLYYRDQLEKDLSVNVYKNSSWGSYRFLPYQRIKQKESDKCHAEVITPGDVSQIEMVENFPYSKDPKETVHIYYAGMNFKDVLIGGGILRLPGTNQNNFEIGYEYSGRKSNGERVFGITNFHAFATAIDPVLPCWKVPDNWTLEEAASIPIIYFTLYYAFYYKTKLEEGKSVLIHSASGGVGMAAIQMALNQNCIIFATVGSEEKKEVLLKEFPQLIHDHIFNSREDSFEGMIKRKTKGRGIDIVLNSLAGDLFNASLRCVATNGEFIEIGKTEFVLNTKMQSSLFLKGASLHAISIDTLLIEENKKVLKKLHTFIQGEIDKGHVKPIPKRKIFDIEHIKEAFKYFQTTTHTGKIIIKIRDEEKNLITPPSCKLVQAIPRLFFNPSKSYIIVGGLGGLGLELALLMSLRGAKHIFLNSRSKPKHGYQFDFIQLMETWGTRVYMNNDDSSILENAEKLLNQALEIAPLGGIFNLAMVNKDNALENQTIEDFEEVFNPKGLVTKNLDILTRKLCTELDHFVAYSSITCGKGNLGQTNYGFANSTMERIIEKRNEDGLPGLVIQWGPIADVGYFAKTSKKESVGYFIAQPVTSYFDVLHEFLLNSSGILASTLIQNIIQTIQAGASLLESVLKLFGITNPDKVSDETTLLELGMDSLMGFEVKQYLFREHEIDITVKDLRNKTIKEIKEIDEKRKKNSR